MMKVKENCKYYQICSRQHSEGDNSEINQNITKKLQYHKNKLGKLNMIS